MNQSKSNAQRQKEYRQRTQGRVLKLLKTIDLLRQKNLILKTELKLTRELLSLEVERHKK